VVNVNAPFAVTGKLFPPLSSSVSPVPASPLTDPPIVNVGAAAHATATVTTFAVAVPLAPVTVQVSAGLVGCVTTVTAYASPLATAVANVNAPFAVTGKLSPPLSASTKPVPVKPVTVPPIVYVVV
jgi:hypothetical protein